MIEWVTVMVIVAYRVVFNMLVMIALVHDGVNNTLLTI